MGLDKKIRVHLKCYSFMCLLVEAVKSWRCCNCFSFFFWFDQILTNNSWQKEVDVFFGVSFRFCWRYKLPIILIFFIMMFLCFFSASQYFVMILSNTKVYYDLSATVPFLHYPSRFLCSYHIGWIVSDQAYKTWRVRCKLHFICDRTDVKDYLSNKFSNPIVKNVWK